MMLFNLIMEKEQMMPSPVPRCLSKTDAISFVISKHLGSKSQKKDLSKENYIVHLLTIFFYFVSQSIAVKQKQRIYRKKCIVHFSTILFTSSHSRQQLSLPFLEVKVRISYACGIVSNMLFPNSRSLLMLHELCIAKLVEGEF